MSWRVSTKILALETRLVWNKQLSALFPASKNEVDELEQSRGAFTLNKAKK